MGKFKKEYAYNRDITYYSLYRRFKIKIYVNELYDIILYRNIESRGFLIEHKGEFYTCPDKIILDGVSKITQN